MWDANHTTSSSEERRIAKTLALGVAYGMPSHKIEALAYGLAAHEEVHNRLVEEARIEQTGCLNIFKELGHGH